MMTIWISLDGLMLVGLCQEKESEELRLCVLNSYAFLFIHLLFFLVCNLCVVSAAKKHEF